LVAFTSYFQPNLPVAGDVFAVLLGRSTFGSDGRERVLSVGRIDHDAPASAYETFAQVKEATGVVFIAYSNSLEVARESAGRSAEMMRGFGIHVHDAIGVSLILGRWSSSLCEDETCCPPEGKPIDEDAVERMAEAGMVRATQTRSEIEATFIPDSDEAAEVWTLLNSPHETVEPMDTDRMRDVLVRLTMSRKVPTLTLARAVRALRLPQRDEVLGMIAGLEGDDSHAVAEGLTELSRYAPKSYRADVLCCAALAWYLTGDGLRANIALNLALKADPTHSLSQLMGLAISNAFTPSAVRSMLTEAVTA
jgi:hypothetical protein